MSSEEEVFQKTAFAVAPMREKDIDMSVPPATGEEYLQRVMIEAKKCGWVTTAKANFTQKNPVPSYIEDVESKSPLAPDLEWQEEQVANFSRLRQQIIRRREKSFPKPAVKLPDARNGKAWQRICLSDEEMDSSSAIRPLLSILLNMGQPTVDQLLEWNDLWLQQRDRISHSHGRWLFALLTCVDLPLHPDTCSSIRSIARSCQKIRKSLHADSDPTEVRALNLLICLVARYFRQTDLADN